MILTVGLTCVAVGQFVLCVLMWRAGGRMKRRRDVTRALAPYSWDDGQTTLWARTTTPEPRLVDVVQFTRDANKAS